MLDFFSQESEHFRASASEEFNNVTIRACYKNKFSALSKNSIP